jgi:equilibrative nucleoside transporter 1/2/3
MLIATFILTTFPLLPLFLPTISTTLLLPSLLAIVLFLNLSGSYFQSAALALASMWGPTEILAALSGQGGVAVLISLVQVSLAIIGALGSSQSAGDEKPSMLAGVGLWGLGSIAAGLCWLAFRFLISHPAYERIVGSGRLDAVGADGGKKSNWNRTVVVLKKNRLLYLAVALDFAVTLVSVFYHQATYSLT